MEIKPKRKMMWIVLFVSIYIAFQLCVNIFHQFKNSEASSIETIFTVAVCLVLTGLCIYFAIYVIQRMRYKRPGLIISKQGIIDNSGFVSAGAIKWIDVTEVNANKVLFSECIILKVRNPKQYINNQKGLFKQTWLSLENKYYDSPVNISVTGLDIKFKELFSVMQQHYLASQVDTRTVVLQREKAVIQQEKTELLDSINYAKRIQTALLPSFATIQKLLGECFVLYLPKDIVSGDFYWVNQFNEWVFFAACDCTGHGVPGALISIVCNNALNRAVKEFGIIEPSKILDKVSELIVESIGTDGEVKDGMDASLMAFNKNTRELFWAGANCPLWIARQESFYELLEFKPDKQALGPIDNRVPYNNHQIEIKKGDILYLFSDGYADQFGGKNGKKLTRKGFKELLMSQRNVSLDQQQNNLLEFHKEYKAYNDQIDDILVMGIRIEH